MSAIRIGPYKISRWSRRQVFGPGYSRPLPEYDATAPLQSAGYNRLPWGVCILAIIASAVMLYAGHVGAGALLAWSVAR